VLKSDFAGRYCLSVRGARIKLFVVAGIRVELSWHYH
jgi:hypothetical protein